MVPMLSLLPFELFSEATRLTLVVALALVAPLIVPFSQFWPLKAAALAICTSAFC